METPDIFHIFNLLEVFLSDFDGVQFHISNPDGEKSKLRVRYLRFIFIWYESCHNLSYSLASNTALDRSLKYCFSI